MPQKVLHSAESRFLLSDGSRPQAARHARPPVSRGTLHLPSSVTVPMSLRVQMTSETSEPRNPRRGGGTWNLGMDSKKKSARLWRARRTWNLEPGTYRNLLAEGSRNQNRGTLHGVDRLKPRPLSVVEPRRRRTCSCPHPCPFVTPSTLPHAHGGAGGGVKRRARSHTSWVLFLVKIRLYMRPGTSTQWAHSLDAE